MTIRKKYKKEDEAKPFLPAEIIRNILSRLPIKDAMQCRLVCKIWRDSTLDHEFVDLHCGNRTPPTILVADSGCHTGVDLFSSDKWWEPARKRSMFHKFPFHSGFLSNTSCALFSHAGLTVFQQNQCTRPYEVIYSILNPTSQETVQITVAEEIRKSQIYGVFFHPILKEYCSLWNIAAAATIRPKQNNFKMLILGSNPRFKTVSNHPFVHKFMLLDRNYYPVFIDKYIYWIFRLKQDSFILDRRHIVEFSIISEEIRVMSCPFVILDKDIRLLNIDGTLSCLTFNSTNVTIWRMEHHTDQLWTSSVYDLNLEKYCLYARPIAVVDGQLVLSFDRRLLVCNLMEGTVKYYQKRRYRQNVGFLSHQMSLASLKNCKPAIFIDQDGQLVVSQIA